jgi:hypothetical protein
MNILKGNVSEILNKKWKKLNSNKHYLLWGMEIELGKDFAERRAAALLKLAIDCGIPNCDYMKITNQAVWDFFEHTDHFKIMMVAYIDMRTGVKNDKELLTEYNGWLSSHALKDNDTNMWSYFEERRKAA